MSESQVTLKKHIPWVFFVAYFTNQVGSTLTLVFLNQFLTEYMGLTPQIMVTSLTAARFADMLVALLGGAIVQKTNMRFGQFRSWLLIIMPVVQLACFIIFINPPMSMQAKGVLVGIAYFFTSAPMNIFVVVHNSLMAKISGANMNNRLAITSKLFQGVQFGGIVGSLVTLRLVALIDPQMTKGFPVVSVILGLCAIGGQILMFVATKDYDKYDPDLKKRADSSHKASIFRMFADTLKNGQIWILLIADTLRQLAVFVLAGMLGYFFIFAVGDVIRMSDGALIQSICSCIAAFFIGPPLVKKLGKKNSCIISAGVAAAAYFTLAFVAKNNWIIYIACTSTAVIGLSMLGAVGLQLYLDAGEYQLYKTGKDNRSYVMSLQLVPMKIGMMLSASVVAKILELSGYVQNADGTNTMTDPIKMVFLIGIIAGGLYVMYLIIMSFFKISEEKSKEYAAANQKALRERAAAAAEQ